jgi:sugar/nucleoside kinase (ribokinase family)
MADVVCLGILVADVVGKPVDKWPGRGELELVDRMELHTGGCAANTGIALAKIGVDVAVIGKVGNDGFGDFMISRLKSHGIDPSGVVRSDKSNTSATMVMVHSDGERSFLHYFGANRDLVEEDVDMALIAKSRILHVAGSFLMPKFDGQPTANVLKKAKELGVTTCLDTCWDATGKWMKVLEPCLPYIDYFVPSIAEAAMLTGKEKPSDIASVLLDSGIHTVALKMGENGSYIRTAESELTIPPFRVQAIDALGAGDAFVAGFLTGLVNGWDLERTGKFANAVGAFCVTALGATTGVMDQETTEGFIRAQECAGGC